MICRSLLILATLGMLSTANAQDNMFLSFDQSDFVVTNDFSDVDTFSFDIEFAEPLRSGVYVNPEIVSVSYKVSGTLVAGTPSGFPAFALERDMTGTEFYDQGSSIAFTIANNAVLSDGVQVAELGGNGVVFLFDGMEIDNGRFHPTIFELRSDGTGLMRNSTNIISLNPFQQIDYGSEYINTLTFDPGNTTILTGTVKKKGGGNTDIAVVVALLMLVLMRKRLWLRSRLPSMAKPMK